MQAEARCPTCGSVLVQKPRWRLILVAVLMLGFSTALFHFVHGFRFVTFTLGLTGCYLFAWAVLGKGGWCRQCKRFPLS